MSTRLSIRVVGVAAAVAALLGLSAASAFAWNPDCNDHGNDQYDRGHEEWSPPKHEHWTPPVAPAPKPVAPKPAAPAPAPVPAPRSGARGPGTGPCVTHAGTRAGRAEARRAPGREAGRARGELGIPVEVPTPEVVPEAPEKTGVLGKVGTRKEKKVKGKVGTRGTPTTTPVALVQAGDGTPKHFPPRGSTAVSRSHCSESPASPAAPCCCGAHRPPSRRPHGAGGKDTPPASCPFVYSSTPRRIASATAAARSDTPSFS